MKLDLILDDADIITLEEARPRARRVGVLHGRIVGFDEELDGCTAELTVPLGGAAVVPGFIDAHCHTTWWGLGLSAVDLEPARGLEEIYALLEAEVERLADQPEAWINGTGYNHKHHGGLLPDIERLDAITGDRPLYLRHVSGHLSITNTATLRLVGALAPDFEDPVGGAVLRGPDGRPTGVVEESAQSLVQSLLLPYSVEQIVQALDEATARYAAQGITSFTEAGIGGGWIGHSPVELQAYQAARRAGRLHARAQLMPTLDVLRPLGAPDADMHGEGPGLGLDLGLPAGFGDDWVSLGPVKVFLDGSLLGATAAVTEDYCGHPHQHGYLLDDAESFRERVAAAYRAGWPVALHAIGDAAIDLATDIIVGCQDKYGRNALPNRIEHFGIARPEQVALVAQAGIAVTPQAAFIGPLGDQMAELVGPDRESWLYRGRSLVDAGAVLAGSSDLPVADNNVRRGMQSWVDRRTEKGRVLGGTAASGAPAEALTPEEALRTYTTWAAAATGTATDKGTLRAGKLADFAVLSGSPLTAGDIGSLDVLATIVGGHFTHHALDLPAVTTAAGAATNGAPR
ncbi:amidohydrolase [Kocuria turfanensis]|uniref:Amidohydrolase n=1 Tax=Kocuria turfanensis TaxID=388357 RepID=A0A512IGR7_9MICC|nr:amidohydrolase [Kocuria turfanensis]GEO96903.1 amidohydrolase [Kocuria turfanensis]